MRVINSNYHNLSQNQRDLYMQAELAYIYAMYKAGSFSKAAEKLYITQPALSMSVKKIEAALGMPLFDRTARPLQLTEAARIY